MRDWVTSAAAQAGDARQLVGYVVSESGLPLDRDALLDALKAQLPPHMVPVVQLQRAAAQRQRQTGSQGAAAAGADQQNRQGARHCKPV